MSANKHLILAMALALHLPAYANEEPLPERKEALVHLVRQDCGSCHGMTFKGGLGPALTPETMRTKPAEAMVATILWGRHGTAMPPWKSYISEGEAKWVVEKLREGFPEK